MSSPASDIPPERSGLERALNVVTEVRAGEGVTALLMTLNLFLLLTAYYVIKPVREALILAMESGAEYKSYMGAVIALTLLVAVPAYGAFANRVQRNRLVVSVTLFFVSNLALFYLASLQPSLRGGYLGLVFYAWVGIFNMMVVAQIWAFANDIYTEEQGKRIFVMIGLGASFGALFGGLIAAFLVNVLGVYQMFLVSGVLLALTAVITQVVHVRQTKAGEGELSAEAQPETPQASKGPSKPAGPSGPMTIFLRPFALVFEHRYLTLLALFSLTFTLVNTNGEYMLGSLASDYAARTAREEVTPEKISIFLAQEGVEARIQPEIADNPDDYKDMKADERPAAAARSLLTRERQKEIIGSFFGTFYSGVNVLSLLLQGFVVSRLVKYLGLARAFFILPVIALLDAAAVALIPMFWVLRTGKTAENAVDYSLNNTLRNMLWLPTTREMKYKAKQAVDTFFVRLGDVLSAVVVFVLAGQLSLGVRAFAITNVILVAAWLLLAAAIVREYAHQQTLRQSEQGSSGP